MAINTSELGETETDMTNWDPDRTDEVAVPRPKVTDADAPASVRLPDSVVDPSVADQSGPAMPGPSRLDHTAPDHTAADHTAADRAVTEPIPMPRPSMIARAATEPAPGLDRTLPVPAQRPSATPSASFSSPDQAASAPATTQLPAATAPRPSQLPPRTEWLGTTPAANSETRAIPSPAPALAPTFNAGPSNTPMPASRPTRYPAPTSTSAFGASSPPPLVTTKVQPAESGKKTGWLWPAIAAFVLGGLMTGLGFRIGTQTTETTAAPAATTVSANTVPPVQDLSPSISADEPAAFVAGKLGPSVVTVETDRGLGSGVIFDDGLIMTNNHVIEGAAQIQVRLANGALLPAELVGADPRTDIAVVSVGVGRDLPIADLALGEELEVGELAIAIGSPFQLQQTVTAGIISALNRPVQNGLGYTAMIQTDAPINPGNSGGALSNREGRLIGINTSIQTAGDSSNAGVGFAVPIDTAYNVALRIIAGQDLVGGFLGVGGGASPDGASGVEVSSLTDGSGAALAGIREGDRIISIDGAPVVNLEQLAGIVSTRFPGEDVEIGLIRGDEELLIVATLGER